MDGRLAQGRSFVGRFSEKTPVPRLRAFVLSVSLVNGAWALFSAIAFFRNAAAYRGRDILGAGQMAQLSTVIGGLYALLLAILSFGVYATYSQKRSLARTYAHLSVIATTVVIAAGILNLASFFNLKDEIRHACQSIASESLDTFTYWLFIGSAVGPISTNLSLDPRNTEKQILADAWCSTEWSRIAKGNVAAFIVTSLIAVFLSFLAFSYSRQVHKLSPARQSIGFVASPDLPLHYNPPYSSDAAGPTDRARTEASYGTPGGLFPGYNPHDVPPPSKGDANVNDQKPQIV